MQMSVTDEKITSRFPVGYYQLHPNVSLNFQLNRFYGWVGEEQMLEEMRAAAAQISSYDDWTREMFKLSDEALAADRTLAAAYYSRVPSSSSTRAIRGSSRPCSGSWTTSRPGTASPPMSTT